MMKQKRLFLLGAGGLAFVLMATVGLVAAQAHGNGGGWGPFGGSARGGFNDTSGTVTGRGVNFSVDAATATISNLDPTALNGSHPLVSSIVLGLPSGASATAQARGHAYLLDDGVGDRILVEDARNAGFEASSVNGTTVTITLPEGASIVTHDAVPNWSPGGATITYANGDVANLVFSKNATLVQSGQTLTVTLGPHSVASFGLVGTMGGHEGRGEGAHGRGPPSEGFGRPEGRGGPGGRR